MIHITNMVLIETIRASSLCFLFFLLNIVGCTTTQNTASVKLDPKGTKDLRGGLTEKEFIRVIHENMKDIRICYETDLKKSKNLHGEIVTKIKISQVGVVSTKTEKNTTKSKPLSACVKDAIESWKFPPSKDGKPTEISYPFIFEPL